MTRLATYLTFGELKPGQRFSFLYGWPPRETLLSDNVLTRLSGNQYRNDKGIKFKTGTLSPVIIRPDTPTSNTEAP